MPSAALRAASRAQGSALLRTVALAGPGPDVAALLALHHLVGGACSAAVRLLGLDPLGLDPLAVAAAAATAGRAAEPVARSAADAARSTVAADDPALLPADGSPPARRPRPAPPDLGGDSVRLVTA
jgi:urease accessory protein